MSEPNQEVMPIDLPVTDEGKPEKVRVNNLQENFIFLLNTHKKSLADVQKATLIPWGTIYAWYIGDVNTQMLDINVKELADYFEVTIDELAFGDMAKKEE